MNARGAVWLSMLVAMAPHTSKTTAIAYVLTVLVVLIATSQTVADAWERLVDHLKRN